ncbi:MAG TPA: D-2-hydroxyacid dehydrogenase [Acidimicrobiales bacterium]
MRILLTSVAAARAAERVLSVAPDAELVEMDGEGSLHDRASGVAIAWDGAAIDVAWPTYDLFDQGAPLRPFFGLLLRATGLRWVHSPAAGVDAPVFAQLVDNGVRLTTTHVTDVPISEYVLRAVLDHYQQPHVWRAAQGRREWGRREFREVAGTVWLVVGIGAIGSAVATRARAFGATVIGARRTPDGREPADRVIRPDELLAVVPEADVVVLAAPATPDTTRLVDDAFLGAMKDGALLVNIARGALVDEAALLTALDRPGGIEAAVLDVTATEPLPDDSPLWSHPAITITPHGSAEGRGRHERLVGVFCENLRRYRAGEHLLHEVTAADL